MEKVYIVHDGKGGHFGAYSQKHVADGIAKRKTDCQRTVSPIGHTCKKTLFRVKEMEVYTLPDNRDK